MLEGWIIGDGSVALFVHLDLVMSNVPFLFNFSLHLLCNFSGLFFTFASWILDSF